MGAPFSQNRGIRNPNDKTASPNRERTGPDVAEGLDLDLDLELSISTSPTMFQPEFTLRQRRNELPTCLSALPPFFLHSQGLNHDVERINSN